jgi:hypothetical protein
MHWFRRLALLATATATFGTFLGFAPPAHAAYSEEPISLPWNPAGAVHSSVSRDGVVYLGGKLDGVGGIAAIDATTGNLLWQVPAGNDVRALALSEDGTTLYAGGSFTSVDGVTHRHLVALDVADHSLISAWKARAAGQVRDLVVSGNTVFVAGRITTVDGFTQRGIGAVDATTGARVTTFNFSADNDVMGLALTGNVLLMAGTFAHVNGQSRSQIAAIDLGTNALTSWAPVNFCGCGTYWDVQTDGTWAYVGASGSGGNFGSFNLTTGEERWPYVHADGDVQTVWLPGDGKVYLGGHFSTSLWSTGSPETAVPATVVASVDLATGLPDPDFTPRIYKTYPGCWTFASTDGKLWVGGDFGGEQVNGKNNKKPYLAAYSGV